MKRQITTHASDPNLIETTFDDVVIIEDLRDSHKKYAHEGEFVTKMASPPPDPSICTVTKDTKTKDTNA